MSAATTELVRLVDRITYGANRGWMRLAESMGYEAFIDWQLEPDRIDDGGLESALLELLPTLSMDAAALARHIFEEQNFGAAQRDLTIATLIRQIYSPRQLHERMVEFWSDHFNVTMNSAATGYFKFLEDRDLMRPLALGRFEDLLQADARSPAMLFYLDNYLSTADGPNENYAREMLELHTLGVDGGYTEDDIKETARVFTGWTIRQPASFFFAAGLHDYGTKTVLGQRFAPSGLSEGEALLSMIAAHESTARHIATKLCRRFVDDWPEPALVDKVAQAFSDSDGDIRITLKALLMDASVRARLPMKLKRPNEFSAAALRALEAELDAAVLTSHYDSLSAGGQLPFTWPAPNGYPDQRGYWQSTNGFLMRFNQAARWTDALADRSPVLREAARFASLDDQIDYLEQALRPSGLSGEARALLKRYSRRLSPEGRLQAMAGWILGSAETQWR
ncbi:DUF1800 domain-containing protein [Wenzhouxiangella marina]|uniref:Uncharacterized protein n=1 Tax=Wenzhouxiangella marina TaxID=1579979 RepID=A0A0K0XRW0_9GAMM|nr:DUF1800 domain-containing protein [Wenzhouxiangella marina]AKS40449.1 hypothetical protein WM2015_58 [Wenzhouxiangella marina]MBB6088229.1 uncharacterized protein (DUF1800 family) [Wenzhouxiangella marina]